MKRADSCSNSALLKIKSTLLPGRSHAVSASFNYTSQAPTHTALGALRLDLTTLFGSQTQMNLDLILIKAFTQFS